MMGDGRMTLYLSWNETDIEIHSIYLEILVRLCNSLWIFDLYFSMNFGSTYESFSFTGAFLHVRLTPVHERTQSVGPCRCYACI